MPKDNSVGITRTDLQAMRRIFDDASIPRPRHCFRWNNSAERWELSVVLPADRTLKAYQGPNGRWITV